MKNILELLDGLRRPALLIGAARIGQAGYRRQAHLRRHLGHGPIPSSSVALARLIEIEGRLERERQESAMTYCVTRHVDVLIAMLGEASALRLEATHPTPQAKASGISDLRRAT